MSRILGIDYGEKNIGLAISDPNNHFALPLETINNGQNLIETLKEIISSKNINCIVVGLPLNLKGEPTKKTEEVERFIKMLENKLNIGIKKVDERLTTREAYNYLMELKELSHSKKKKKTDTLAASLILQKYLDNEKMRRRNEG